MVKILLVICGVLVSIFSMFTAPDVKTTSAKSISLTAISGTTNSANPFYDNVSYFRMYSVDGSWSVIKDWTPDSLYYIYNGVGFNSNSSFYIGGGERSFAIDIIFKTSVLFNNRNTFTFVGSSDILGADFYGALNSLQAYVNYDGFDELITYNTPYISEDEIRINFTPTAEQGTINILKLQLRFNANYGMFESDTIKYVRYGIDVDLGDYSLGYDDGYNTGYDIGYDIGYDDGLIYANSVVNTSSASYGAGYTAGLDEALNTSDSFYSMVVSVLDAPVQVFLDTFNFEIFGINVSNVILSLFTLAVVTFIIKLLL